MASPLPNPALILVLESAFNDANATRWLSGEQSSYSLCPIYLLIKGTAAGLTLLLYDHLMTLPDEINLIWRSRPSFSKYGFLVNRYMVPMVLTMITVEMCGFSGLFITNQVSSND